MTTRDAHGGLREMFAPALLVLGAMLPSTVVIPVIRRFVASAGNSDDWAVHLFMTVNLLGACVGGPILAGWADRVARRRVAAAGLALIDGLMMALVALKPPLAVMLWLRLVQGASSVGAVSLLMGAARGRAKSGAAMGVVGSAVVLAIVLGIPLGAILGQADPAVPLLVGGVVGMVTGVVTFFVLPKTLDAQAAPQSLRALAAGNEALRAPTLVVGLERFAVGGFVVTLQLFGHHVLHVEDATISRWFSAFLVTFALATWPMTRLGERFDRWKVIAVGAAAYALMFVTLGFLQESGVVAVLLLGGLGSAAIYGPSLNLAAQSVPSVSRASAMAMLNAAGTLGMFLGNLLGALLSTALIEAGVDRATAYAAVFVTLGVTQLVSVFMCLHNAAKLGPATDQVEA